MDKNTNVASNITYNGEVRFEIVTKEKKRKIIKKVHNEGYQRLFNYLLLSLDNYGGGVSINNMKNRCPYAIIASNNNGESLTTYPMPRLTTASYYTTGGVSTTINDTTNIATQIEFKFLASISGDKDNFKVKHLYLVDSATSSDLCTTVLSDVSSKCLAHVELSDVVTLSASSSSNLFIYWRMSFVNNTNASSMQNGD